MISNSVVTTTKYDDGAKQQRQTRLTFPHHHLETMATTDGAAPEIPEIQINVKGMLSSVSVFSLIQNL